MDKHRIIGPKSVSKQIHELISSEESKVIDGLEEDRKEFEERWAFVSYDRETEKAHCYSYYLAGIDRGEKLAEKKSSDKIKELESKLLYVKGLLAQPRTAGFTGADEEANLNELWDKCRNEVLKDVDFSLDVTYLRKIAKLEAKVQKLESHK